MPREGEPRYPDITVPLTGEDGNIFSIAGRAGRLARRAEVPRDEIDEFYKEVSAAQSYDAALQVVMRWFDTD
jgi:hypothetical protein